ncbi:hypothetical protein [Actinoplanes sp. NPDC051859]|uniref:hypothetical protein n=1 Tax=Actinoplanes sp. NPDC051859 TaxID=3363909 RepID=UPI0037A2EFCC
MITAAARSIAPNTDVDSVRENLVTRVLQRYPATCIMVVPYLLLVIPQAVWYQNPRTYFLVGLIGLALCGAGLIETALLKLRPLYPQLTDRVSANSRYPRILLIARPVAIIGVAADIVSAAAGGGGIGTQITGRAATSPLVPILTPLITWKYMALALFASACLGGLMNKSSFYRWTAAIMGAQFVVAALSAITAPMVNFFSFIILACMLLGLFRARLAVTLSLILLLAWPAIFAVRNQIREDQGITVSTEVTAQERLRFDTQITEVDKYEVPARVPGFITPENILRYGLVPRALDSSRPILATGGLVSDYIGGSRTNSYSFLPLGNLYFFTGPYGVMLFYSLWALALALLLRTGQGPGPGRLMLLFVAIAGPLSWTSSYPESVVGYLQSMVAMLPVFGALRLFGRDPESPDA